MNQEMFDSSPVSVARRHMLLLTASVSAAIGGLLATPARGAVLAEVDVKTLGEAWRASTLIGATAINDQNQKIGSVDDLLITPEHQVLAAVISVGGFLGINSRLVAVPWSSLQIDDQGRKVVLPGATKDALNKFPPFRYL